MRTSRRSVFVLDGACSRSRRLDRALRAIGGHVVAIALTAGMPFAAAQVPNGSSTTAEPATTSASRDQSGASAIAALAEEHYRGERWPQALESFAALVEADPGFGFGWLRLGNLHHRAGHLDAASQAYRQAADLADGEIAIRRKALHNLALVALEQIESLVTEAGNDRDATLLDHIDALRTRLHQSADVRETPAQPARSASRPMPVPTQRAVVAAGRESQPPSAVHGVARGVILEYPDAPRR